MSSIPNTLLLLQRKATVYIMADTERCSDKVAIITSGDQEALVKIVQPSLYNTEQKSYSAQTTQKRVKIHKKK